MATAKDVIAGTIFIGYTTKVRDPETARNHLTVKPPGTLRRPESVQAWRDDPEKQEAAWAHIDNLAKWTKLCGAVASIRAYDVRRAEHFTPLGGKGGDPGTNFVLWLLKNYDFPAPHQMGLYPIRLYGFNLKPLMRIAGQAAIRAEVKVPLTLWYAKSDNHIYDPKEMLLESAVKDIYPMSKICDEAPGGRIPIPDGYVPHADAETDLRLTVELCMRYQLLTKDADFLMFDRGAEHALLNGVPSEEDEQSISPADEGADEKAEASASRPTKKRPSAKKKSAKKKS